MRYAGHHLACAMAEKADVAALVVLCHVRMGDLAIGRILRWTVYGFALLLAFLCVGCLLFGKARLMDWLGSIP